jgi:hypothetical protein
MRLYTRTGATAVADPQHGQFKAGQDGGFDLPDALGQRLHGFHIDGQPLWETDIERQHRLIAEEMERRKDPATLLDAVQQLVQAAQAASAAQAAQADAPAAKPAPAKKAATAAAG